MRNSPISLLCLGLCFLVITHTNAQQNTLITGSIKNSQTKENLAAVSVVIKGSTSGTYTDEKGNFRLVTDKTPPFTIVISSIGYTEKEITVESANQNIDTELEPSYALGQDIVIAASRLPQRILEAPVTIDRINANAIRNAPGPNYYDALGNLKGVDVVNSSYTFKTISTHGFNGSGNLRFNQLVDGMDNSAPALNFSVGNVIGLTDLDVDNMELLSGASSALYGSGGMNGTLLITSKDPFKYQGFSIEVKEGIMHINDYRHKASPLHDIAFRWGKKVSDKFAFKIGAEYIKADDWRADDSTDLLRNNVFSKIKPGTRATDENYDGVNVYGDEVSAFIPQLGFAFSRTGYYEKDLVDYNTYDLKISGGAYYKISPNTEVSLSGNWGAGTTVYTGADRYALKNLSLGQYKLEFKNPNWFLRGYTTQENSGDSYAATLTAISIDETWKDDPTWFGTYAYVFGTAVGNNIPVDQAYIMARAAADDGRLLPGTKGFETAFKKVISTPISEGGVAKNGSKFVDKSSLYHFEGQYNFSQFVKAVNILVGADYRWYNLNSHNTIFYEPDGPLKISEYGVYTQLQKSLLDDVLKLSVSGRYDKGENFNGRFTPRATATIKVAKDNNIRLSYQQAYRYPNNQDQYINLFTPGSILVGCLPVFNTLYHFDTNPVYTAESVGRYRSEYINQGIIDSSLLEVANFAKGKPETMSSYEIGYRGVINTKLFIDAYYYFSTYKNFIGRQAGARADNRADLLNPLLSTNFSFVVNSSKNVNANGWGIGADYQIGKGYMITANIFSDQLTNVDSTFITFFNTPKTRFNIGLSNSNLGKGFGFNIIYRWQDKTYWESTFGTGEIPAYGTLDAQVSYHFTKQKVLIKLGGTNITNHYYRNAFGNPYIGGLYYVSMGFDIF
jgi:outer membrane receptor protein involved in Fe transport